VSSHVPFVFRALAEVWRLLAWPVRAFLAAVGADPAACLALGVLLLTALLSFPLALRVLIVGNRWVEQHVAAHREQRELDAAAARIEPLYDSPASASAPSEHMEQTVRIAPHATVLPRREVPRRPRRFPGRRIRRHHTSTSNSERSS